MHAGRRRRPCTESIRLPVAPASRRAGRGGEADLQRQCAGQCRSAGKGEWVRDFQPLPCREFRRVPMEIGPAAGRVAIGGGLIYILLFTLLLARGACRQSTALASSAIFRPGDAGARQKNRCMRVARCGAPIVGAFHAPPRPPGNGGQVR